MNGIIIPRSNSYIPCASVPEANALVSFTLHNSRIERASKVAAVEQFQIFADIEHLETSIRAERDYTTSVVILGGHDASANELMMREITPRVL